MYGRAAVVSFIENSPDKCRRLLVADGAHGGIIEEIVAKARENGISVEIVKKSRLDKLRVNHQGVSLMVHASVVNSLADLIIKLPKHPEHSLIIAADHIEDPHNLGAIIRSAEVFGAAAVIFPNRRAAGATGAVMKSSAGAGERITLVEVPNLSRALAELKEEHYFWTIGLSEKSLKPIWDIDMPERTVIVIGGEQSGISRTTASECDFSVNIPMYGNTGSLNASVAGGIAMYEWVRQIRK